jgi:hypothetical protein
MKDPLQFSKKQLNNFRWKKANDGRVNGITAKLCCRVCVGEQRQELQCNGPCGLWKCLDEFSKAQRRVSGIAVSRISRRLPDGNSKANLNLKSVV